ncbi:MAG: hypothetical protein ABIP93_19345 [Gemmatimonadaceae bacterium]
MNKSTRDILALSAALFLAACTKSDKAADTAAAVATDSAGAMAAPAPAPAAALNLADVAGKWKTTTRPDTGPDTTTTTGVLTATADTKGWMMELPSGVKVPLQVKVAGDTLLVTSDTYSSVRRKGVKVFSESKLTMQNGMLVGLMTGHYKVTTPDSVLVMRTEATKMP